MKEILGDLPAVLLRNNLKKTWRRKKLRLNNSLFGRQENYKKRRCNRNHRCYNFCCLVPNKAKTLINKAHKNKEKKIQLAFFPFSFVFSVTKRGIVKEKKKWKKKRKRKRKIPLEKDGPWWRWEGSDGVRGRLNLWWNLSRSIACCRNPKIV